MVVGIVIGLVIGAIGAYSVKMTAMPQMVAAFNGLGGGSAALVTTWNFCEHQRPEGISTFSAITMLLATLIGSLSFSGHVIAFLKLQGPVSRNHGAPSPAKIFSMA